MFKYSCLNPGMGSTIRSLSELAPRSDEALKTAIFRELTEPDLTPLEYAALLDALLEAGFEPAIEHAVVQLGRVGDWRAGLGRSLCSLLARSFVCECHTISAVPRFQPPPRRTQHADFPHCALLFASPQGLWGLSCRSGFRRWSNHSVAIEQLQSLVQPSPTPPRPAEALSVPGSHMDVQSPELPGRLSLRLDVYSPPQVLQIDGRICHLVLAFLVVGDFTNSRAPSLRGRYPPHRYYEPIRHPLAFDRLPG